MRIRHLATSFALFAAAGCDSCHRKPYTPYTLGDAPSSSAPSTSSAATQATLAANEDGGASFAIVNGEKPPGDGKTWPLEGASVDAPPGRTFAVGVTSDVDGDGKQDLVAWARSPDGLRGELWFAPGSAPSSGRVVAALPGDLSVPGCSARASLSIVAPKMALLDYEPKCPESARDRAARWLAFVKLDAPEPKLALELHVAELPEGEKLTTAVSTEDRDKDGRPDLALTLTLTTPRASASSVLAFVDRPAGYSRDASEPEASLRAFVAQMTSEAKRRSTAQRAIASGGAFFAMDRALCEDAGHARITTPAGAIACGDPKVREDAAAAEAIAALTLADAPEALAAIGRLDTIAKKPHKDIEQLLAKLVDPTSASVAHKCDAQPASAPPPSFSPLAFLPTGDLLIKTSGGVIRVDKTSFAEKPEAAAAFSDKLTSPPDKPRWSLDNLSRQCALPGYVAKFTTPEGAIESILPIAIGPKCVEAQTLSVSMLGDTADASLFAVGPDAVVVPWSSPPKPGVAESLAMERGGVVPLGAARSPDGSRIALATSRGVLVVAVDASGKPGKSKLWNGPDLEGATSCVPSDGGTRLACVKAGAAVVYEAK